ncbi:MAG: nitronate monooxygenase, partial [Methylocella sp.]
MLVAPEIPFEVIAQTAASFLDPSIAISAIQAGHSGVFDLEFADLRDERTAKVLRRFATSCAGPLGLKLRGDSAPIDELPAAVLDRLRTVILTPAAPPTLSRSVKLFRARGPASLRLLLEAVSPEEAELAKVVHCDGIVAKGNESGGRVGESTTFILLQQLRSTTELPVWAQGGIGLHTIAAAYVAGAAGVVVDQQLLLTRESRLPDALRKTVARMDGSETQCLGDELGCSYRIFAGPASAAFNNINRTARRLANEGEPAEAGKTWRESLR